MNELLRKLVKNYRICTTQIETKKLVKEHPPNLYDENKQLLFSISMSGEHKGTITFSKYSLLPLPETITKGKKDQIVHFEDVYSYKEYPIEGPKREWYVNFADKHLFGYYGSPLFAQDELQVGEHPALGCLREFLSKQNSPGFEPTTRKDGKSTPCLISGVERRVNVALDANAKEGRPRGLYGNSFALASQTAIRKAITKPNPPTITNFICIEAPKYGRGKYTKEQILDAFMTAYTGFVGAKCESYMQDEKVAPKVIVHTGNWGTGAYGGNVVLMALLQIMAARAANLDLLVYHTFAKQFTDSFLEARKIFDNLVKDEAPTEELLQKIYEMGFIWGVSNNT